LHLSMLTQMLMCLLIGSHLLKPIDLPVCVPMDDNVPPRRYEPMIDFILDRAGLERP